MARPVVAHRADDIDFLTGAGLPPVRPPRPPEVAREEMTGRGAAVLRSFGLPSPASAAAAAATLGMALPELGRSGPGLAGLAALARAVARRDALEAGEAGERLVGLGPGLTPAGDDVIAGTAATIAVLGGAAGMGASSRRRWLSALVPASLRDRTNPLSATLLELAARGIVIEPAARLLDLTREGAAGWPAALHALRSVGHSTGRAHAVAVGAAAVLLGSR